jgi:predicted ribosome-associated RNA-binding protein Tma20
MPRQLQEGDHVRGVHHAGYGTDVVVVGAGAVVEVCDGLEVVVDTGGGIVGS